MAVSRDRISLTTPKPQNTVKGFRIDPAIDFDLSTRRIIGTISFYDSAGNFLSSKVFSARVNQNQRDALAAAIEADIFASDPTLAGTATVEQVNDVNDPPVNP